MCESVSTRAAASNLNAAECLLDGKQEPKERSYLSDKKEQQSMICQKLYELKRSADNSLVEGRLGVTDDELGCTRTSGSVSHEELRALTGCVTRGRVLFSPKSFLETSSPVLQATSASTSSSSRLPHHHHYAGSLKYDNHKGNPPISSASNSIPDSVSVQFDCACYDSETICQSLVEHQQSYTGLNIAAISESNIDVKSTDSNRQRMVDFPLSCSIPGELNTCNAHSTKFPGLKNDSTDQSLEFSLCHAKEKFLHSSWPCHHFCHNKEENSTSALHSCSAKHVAHVTTPHQVARLLLAKQHSYLPTFQGNIGMTSSLSSSLEVASALSISSYRSVSDSALSLSDRQHLSYSTGVDGQAFKDKTEVSFKNLILQCTCCDISPFVMKVFLTWFEEFNDQQRNMLLQKLLVSNLHTHCTSQCPWRVRSCVPLFADRYQCGSDYVMLASIKLTVGSPSYHWQIEVQWFRTGW
jgi:hypothetical protein